MSNTSYQAKDNNNVLIQGGEKKVMKKILSVALSTAMAFSMFASVAFGDTALTQQQKFDILKEAKIVNGYPGTTDAKLQNFMTRAEFAKVVTNLMGYEPVEGKLSFKDKVYTKTYWAAPYIEAVNAAGLMEGKNTTKKLFFPKDNVTVQEMAAVLVRALKLEVPTNANNEASNWAKGYVQAAIDAKIIDAKANPKANATRGQLMDASYAIYLSQQQPKVVSYKVSENGKVVEFTLANSKVVKVTLETALEPNKETEVKFSNDGYSYTHKVTWVVTDATKVQSVSANNLREVVVAFDGEVDPVTAGDESNYSINNGVTVKQAKLSSDKRTVTLTVETGTNQGLINQREYKLTVSNVRAGSKVISATDVKFTPVDAALPVAQSAQALGNKAIKVTFSEPIKEANSNSFKIDGNNFVGSTEVIGNVVIVKLYNTLSNGEHTLSVAGVQDYSTLKNLATDLKFTVVEDKTAPTIAAVEKATFEEVTLKFSEPVDKATVLASNVYWMQGATKRTASSVDAISDDTYKFTFNSTNKLVYTTDLFVAGVKDYSGNVIADNTKVQVNPVVDQIRPEVVNATLNDVRKEITVKFSKNVSDTALKSANYVIKDADGKEVSVLKDVARKDAKTVVVTLYPALAEGKTYTLEITGVADTTTLQNVMLPYSKTLTVGDATDPTATSATYVGQKVVVEFNEVMATSGDGSIAEYSKYQYRTKTGAWKTVTSDIAMNVASDGKSAILVFPSDLVVGTDVTGIRVSLVKDVAGNYIQNLQQEFVGADFKQASALALEAGSNAEATATNKIKVKFNQTLQSGSAVASDFVVKAGGIELAINNAEVDGKNVILTLADNSKLDANGLRGSAPVVTVKANGYLATPAGKQVTAELTSSPAVDKIAPSITEVDRLVTVTGGTYFDVKFSEKLEAATVAGNGVYDFEVRVNGKTLAQGTDFNISTNGDNVVRVNLLGTVAADNKGNIVEVRIKPYPTFVKDVAGNVVAGTTTFFPSYIPE